MKPNIVLITFDEMRRDSLSLYGNKAITTPNLDALALSGTRYENCYTPSPLCLPARCSILTGLYPHNSKAYSNFRDCALDPDVPNLFNILKQNGYKTGMAGKCHFAPVDYDSARPNMTQPMGLKAYYQSLGIDELHLQDGKSNSIWFLDDYSEEMQASGHLEEYRRLTWDKMNNGDVFTFPYAAELHPDRWVGRKSAELIDCHDTGAPLFVWASFSGPHYAYDTPAEYRDMVDVTQLGQRSYLDGEFDDVTRIHHTSYHGPSGIDACSRVKDGACKNFTEEYWQELRIQYHANVKLLDDMVGEILKSAKRKFGDNTMVLFTTDHGELLGDHGLWGKNNCVYEPVWRVPMFVKYPGGQAGAVADCKVSTHDIMPTCAAVAGIDVPAGLDGRDMRASELDGGYKYIFSEAEGFAAITDGVYKYVHLMQGNKNLRELYDLSKDPEEFHNFVNDESHREILNRLRDEMIVHFMKDALP